MFTVKVSINNVQPGVEPALRQSHRKVVIVGSVAARPLELDSEALREVAFIVSLSLRRL